MGEYRQPIFTMADMLVTKFFAIANSQIRDNLFKGAEVVFFFFFENVAKKKPFQREFVIAEFLYTFESHQ